MNRVVGAAVGAARFGARAVAAVGGGIAMGASVIFNRGRAWGSVLLARTRIDYRAEIGDPATNSIVGAVVGWIARNLPQSPIRIVHEGTTDVAYQPGPTGPGAMLRVLENPNPYYSGLLQMMATIVDHHCWGNAYWIKERSPAGRVIRLWWVPQHMMEPRWPADDPTVFIGWYEYKVDGRIFTLEPADVVHFRYGIDPRNPRKGLSPLASLFREIFTDDEAANFTASLLRNLGVPGVVLSPSNTTGPLTQKQDPEQVKAKFMEKFSGDRRGEPLILTAPTDVKVLSFNPQEMELRQLRRIPEERISANLGVPAGVAQLGAGLDRNTFTNYGEGNVAAYTQGVIPKQQLMAADLDRQLLPDFAGNEAVALDVWFDWTKAPAMQSATEAIWKRLADAATKGLITRADFKRGTGQVVSEADRVYILPNNYAILPVDGSGTAGGSQPPGGRTPSPNVRSQDVPADASAGALAPPTPIAEARCPDCSKLLGYDVTGARFICPRCKKETVFGEAVAA